MKKLKVRLTKSNHLRLSRGSKSITIRSRSELERVGHGALDAAVLHRDASTSKNK
jgi:hypothetical protein